MEKAVGFYWTLPVPWAGFTDLSEDIESAARQSKTIRYQMEMVRRFTKQRGLRIVAEKVFLEIEPDRGSGAIDDALRAAEKLCRNEAATLIFVNFSQVHGSRSHDFFRHRMRDLGLSVVALEPDPLSTADWTFDPYAHFSDWKRLQRDWISQKPTREAQAFSLIAELRHDGLTFAEIAQVLAERNVATPVGKLWTGDNVRMFMRKHAATPGRSAFREGSQ